MTNVRFVTLYGKGPPEAARHPTVILSTKYTLVTVDALPKLTIAGRKRFSHEAVGVEHLSTASIQPRDLLALQSRDITERIGLDYDKCTLETSQSAQVGGWVS